MPAIADLTARNRDTANLLLLHLEEHQQLLAEVPTKADEARLFTIARDQAKAAIDEHVRRLERDYLEPMVASMVTRRVNECELGPGFLLRVVNALIRQYPETTKGLVTEPPPWAGKKYEPKWVVADGHCAYRDGPIDIWHLVLRHNDIDWFKFDPVTGSIPQRVWVWKNEAGRVCITENIPDAKAAVYDLLRVTGQPLEAVYQAQGGELREGRL